LQVGAPFRFLPFLRGLEMVLHPFTSRRRFPTMSVRISPFFFLPLGLLSLLPIDDSSVFHFERRHTKPGPRFFFFLPCPPPERVACFVFFFPPLGTTKKTPLQPVLHPPLVPSLWLLMFGSHPFLAPPLLIGEFSTHHIVSPPPSPPRLGMSLVFPLTAVLRVHRSPFRFLAVWGLFLTPLSYFLPPLVLFLFSSDMSHCTPLSPSFPPLPSLLL